LRLLRPLQLFSMRCRSVLRSLLQRSKLGGLHALQQRERLRVSLSHRRQRSFVLGSLSGLLRGALCLEALAGCRCGDLRFRSRGSWSSGAQRSRGSRKTPRIALSQQCRGSSLNAPSGVGKVRRRALFPCGGRSRLDLTSPAKS
jgi:hypothetical protein